MLRQQFHVSNQKCRLLKSVSVFGQQESRLIGITRYGTLVSRNQFRRPTAAFRIKVKLGVALSLHPTGSRILVGSDLPTLGQPQNFLETSPHLCAYVKIQRSRKQPRHIFRIFRIFSITFEYPPIRSNINISENI